MPENIPSSSQSISVIGGGAWGTALAAHFHRRGHLHCLYTSYQETITSIKEHGVSPHLRDIVLDQNLCCSRDIAIAAQAKTLLIAAKLTRLEQTLHALAPHITQQNIVLCTKGILENGALPHQLAQQITPRASITLLSGPSFAHDLAAGLPVAVVLAGTSLPVIETLARQLWDSRLRIYPSNDIDGVAWCGALKNVLAIANGIARGLKVGSSGEAALITRGLAELRELTTVASTQNNTHPETDTCASLAGLGDLLLTCSSTRSRNMQLGMWLGEGLSVAEARDSLTTSAEGYHTTRIIPDVIARYQIALPIMDAVYQVLYNDLPPIKAMQQLLERRPSFMGDT